MPGKIPSVHVRPRQVLHFGWPSLPKLAYCLDRVRYIEIDQGTMVSRALMVRACGPVEDDDGVGVDVAVHRLGVLPKVFVG